MSNNSTDQMKLSAEEHKDRMSYVWGLIAALVLTVIPFGLVYFQSLSRTSTLVIIGVFALIQMLVHFRYFLHVGWKQHREDLLLLLFSGSLLFFLIAGTLWVMANLATRMMDMMSGMGM
ncbi:cytochrome o ubiquinol oxidase subunit IV [Pusillimonas sp. CC-YST705]|uniref:Cytochrome bo(3) ubiquinol oxidase subunit 4 n=1 Tax=Mesopusillimonas faecipullorum TaxID=2755040 RepID=A0ABS8CCX0_9BURK|nr:cytochrome o ubiquinol oxidase subunit IV [Mesopusillimonas faecipullorum]MCB5363866.1 cytochrome o ubiquinol oxidase subunit IV [Mesopusillimonas faecipullorum]